MRTLPTEGKGFEAHQLDVQDAGDLPEMDRYLLARTRNLVAGVQKSLDSFAISDACDAVADYIDGLTNWYIRNSRDRFWNEDPQAFNTLYTALEVLCRVIAPLAPMEAETIWRGLTGGESVHLTDWPYLDGTGLGGILRRDDGLVSAMDKVREIVSGTLSLRKARQIRVRQPLSTLSVLVSDVDAVSPYADLIKSELNVKEVRFSTLEAAAGHGLRIISELKVNARAAGPRLGKRVQSVIKASKSGDWHKASGGGVAVATPDGEIPLEPGEYELVSRVEETGGNTSDPAGTPQQGETYASAALPRRRVRDP